MVSPVLLILFPSHKVFDELFLKSHKLSAVINIKEMHFAWTFI